MPKAKAHPDQLGFTFVPPTPASGIAALAGLEQRICRTAATILNSDARSRAVLAAEMSELLDETISKEMLDAYASPARLDHRVPMSRFFALVAVTGRQDLLDPLVREIGAALLVGEEVHTARLGHLRRQIEQLKTEMRRLEGSVPLIRTGGMDGNAGA
jgi:hypothetical protein